LLCHEAIPSCLERSNCLNPDKSNHVQGTEIAAVGVYDEHTEVVNDDDSATMSAWNARQPIRLLVDYRRPARGSLTPSCSQRADQLAERGP